MAMLLHYADTNTDIDWIKTTIKLSNWININLAISVGCHFVYCTELSA